MRKTERLNGEWLGGWVGGGTGGASNVGRSYNVGLSLVT